MKHRTTPWLLLAGLTLACAAHAGEPALQDATAQDQPAVGATDSMNVGIDPKTGKLRQPTAAELKVLQEKSAAMTPRSAVRSSRGTTHSRPQTAVEARATMRAQRGGALSMQVPDSAMSQMTVNRSADGQLHISEDAQAQQTRAEVTE